MLDIQIAAAKINKYASRESGDTVEVVERPGGGFTALLADGQGSGRASKTISQIVVGRAVAMLKDGARDGSVARAVHDYLYMHRGGKVGAELIMLSVDLASRTVILTRNSHCPVLLIGPPPEAGCLLPADAPPLGIYRRTRPLISEVPLAAGLWVVAVSDGVLEAGRRVGRTWDVPATAAALIGAAAAPDATLLADGLLATALDHDSGRPQDDMSVLVLAVLPQPETLPIRRLGFHILIE